jgi:hypothetical protein
VNTSWDTRKTSEWGAAPTYTGGRILRSILNFPPRGKLWPLGPLLSIIGATWVEFLFGENVI